MARASKIAVLCLLLAGASLLTAGFWIPAKALLAQHLLQRAWQLSLESGNPVKPWPWADTWPVGRLQNSRLGVDLIVLEGESGEVLAFGPGHLSKSGEPGGKDHCILAGHRDTSFAFLKDLKPGDQLFLEGKGTAVSFTVQSSGVVRAEELYLDSEKEGALTLITCFPFDAVMPGTPFRYVVIATAEPEEVVSLEPSSPSSPSALVL